MKDPLRGFLPFRHGVKLYKDQSPKNAQEKEEMKRIPYILVVGSLMYTMLCTRLNICFAVEL